MIACQEGAHKLCENVILNMSKDLCSRGCFTVIGQRQHTFGKKEMQHGRAEKKEQKFC